MIQLALPIGCLPASAADEGAPGTAADQSSAAADPSSAAADQSSAAAGPGANANRRYVLKGKTAVIEIKLDDLQSYRAGRIAFEKRDYRRAEILFKQAVAQLGQGYEAYRGECLYFRGRCLAVMDKKSEAINLFKTAARLFELHDAQNQYRAMALAQLAELSGGKARADKGALHGGVATHNLRVSVDQHVTLAGHVTASDSGRFLVPVEDKAIPKIVYNCFADMTCLETAEIGSNVNNATVRWKPLLVEDNPAAFGIGSNAPAINVKLNGLYYKIDLPTFRGLRRILLATDNEKIVAMDIDSYESWLLHIKRARDGSLQSYHWAKLTHVKDGVDSTAGSSTPNWLSGVRESTSWDGAMRGREINFLSGTRTLRNGNHAAERRTLLNGDKAVERTTLLNGNTERPTLLNGNRVINREDAPRHFSKERRGGRASGDSGF